MSLSNSINSVPTKPKQYLQGYCEFYKLKFKIDARVLIPRPESELLVGEVLEFIDGKAATIVDVGTGSGCLAISIAKNAPKVRVLATDISEDALQVARVNSKIHRTENKIIFLKDNLISSIDKCPDVIVANLPYIPNFRLPLLDASVTDFEPKIALDGGWDGFELYRQLFSQIKNKGFRPKLMVYEIDYSQADLAINEAKKKFYEYSCLIKYDLAKKQRILLIKN